MNIFPNLINKRNLTANSKYAILNPFFFLLLFVLIYEVLFDENVKNVLNNDS